MSRFPRRPRRRPLHSAGWGGDGGSDDDDARGGGGGRGCEGAGWRRGRDRWMEKQAAEEGAARQGRGIRGRTLVMPIPLTCEHI